jgi:hypothetical protein
VGSKCGAGRTAASNSLRKKPQKETSNQYKYMIFNKLNSLILIDLGLVLA